MNGKAVQLRDLMAFFRLEGRGGMRTADVRPLTPRTAAASARRPSAAPRVVGNSRLAESELSDSDFIKF